MGMSASQARLLMLTARKSDLEYQAQQITQAKLALARETEAASIKYADALANMKTQVKQADGSYANINLASIINAPAQNGQAAYAVFIKGNNGKFYLVENKDCRAYGNGSTFKLKNEVLNDTQLAASQNASGSGDRVIFDTENQNGINAADYKDTDFFMQKYNAGDIIILKLNDEGNYEPINPSSSAGFKEVDDTSDDALAEAEYNLETKKIQTKEKQLDMNLKQIETQHTAVTNEMESVQKIVKDNVEKTFKTFA